MPKEMDLSKSEYPDLEGLEDGTDLEIRIKAKVQSQDAKNVKINISSFDVDSGNKADKELESMTGKKKVSSSDTNDEDDF